MNDPRAYMTGKRWIEAGVSPDAARGRRPRDRPQGARLMRIVGGRYRGVTLAELGAGDPAAQLRPTSDRVRESLFNLLAHGAYGDPPPPEGRRVLDLFAGTGALGLEALSRGAAAATFVDRARRRWRSSAATSPASASRRAPASSPATPPGSAATPARPSTSSSSTRPMAAASASAALASALAGGWVAPGGARRLGGGRQPPPPPGLTLLDSPPLWGDHDRDLPQHRAAAGRRRAMSEARAPARPGLRLPRLPPRPGGDRHRRRGRPRRPRHHADRRRQVALLPAPGADPPRRHPGRSRR